jgi:tetratricopeptide (TPR) repeat protein
MAAAILSGLARVKSQSRPTITIPPTQVWEFDQKRKSLEEADALLSEGKYEQALERYEAYLAKYPQSIAAQQGREHAREALEKPKQKKTIRKSRPKDEDISPRELLDRLKRVFKRD